MRKNCWPKLDTPPKTSRMGQEHQLTEEEHGQGVRERATQAEVEEPDEALQGWELAKSAKRTTLKARREPIKAARKSSRRIL